MVNHARTLTFRATTGLTAVAAAAALWASPVHAATPIDLHGANRVLSVDEHGTTLHTNAQLAAGAIRDCLQRGGAQLSNVSLLVSGSSGGDAVMPGFANMIQGELTKPVIRTAPRNATRAA